MEATQREEAMMVEEPNFDLHLKDFNSNTIALYFTKRYGGKQFIYVSEKLYHYTGVYWKHDPKCLQLHKFITSVFVPETLAIVAKLLDTAKSPASSTTTRSDDAVLLCREAPEIGPTEKKAKRTASHDLAPKEGKRRRLSPEASELVSALEKFQKQFQKILNIQLRSQIVKEILIELTNDNIKLNSHAHLFPFENCVWDFKLNQWVEPRPDFFITQTTGYCYEARCADDEAKQLLHQFYESVLPAKENRDYYLDFCSTALLGSDQKLVILKGPSNSGKSTANRILLSILGEFGSVLPFSVLCSNGGTKTNSFWQDYDQTLDTTRLHNSRDFKRLTVASQISHQSGGESHDNTLMTTMWKSLVTGEREIVCAGSSSRDRKRIHSAVTLILEMTNPVKFGDCFNESEDCKLMEYIQFSQVFHQPGETTTTSHILQSRLTDPQWFQSIRSYAFDQLKLRAHHFLQNQHQLSQRPDDFNQLKGECNGTTALSRWFLARYEAADYTVTVYEVLEAFYQSSMFQILFKAKRLEYRNYDGVVESMAKDPQFATALKRTSELFVINARRERALTNILAGWRPKRK
jgi:hypothetical protein